MVLKPTVPDEEEESDTSVYISDDGTRMVEVSGERKNAFLYDLIPEDGLDDPKFITFLGSEVTEVRFASSEEGILTQILIVNEAGTFALFDPDGNPFNLGGIPNGEEDLEGDFGDPLEIPDEDSSENLSKLRKTAESVLGGTTDWGSVFDGN